MQLFSKIAEMLWIVAHLHVRDWEAFNRFEDEALQTFVEHGGEVIARFKPEAGPDEIHVLSIGRQAFEAFKVDPRLILRAELRAQGIERTELFISA